MTRTLPLGLLLAAAVAVPAQAQDGDQKRRADIAPYIEVGQVLTADLSGDGDVLTYSTVTVGIDASVHTRRVEVQVDYSYQRRFAESRSLYDDDVHSGIARVNAKIAPGLSIDAGGLATRTRSDIRGPFSSNLIGDTNNSSQLFSGYVAPTLSTRAGPFSISGAYQYGYTKVEEANGTSGTTGLDSYDSSQVQMATASIGVRSGVVAPFGFTVSGGWDHEDARQLDQRYNGKFVRADVVQPVGGGFAVEGGVGYEKITITQRDPLVDSDGNVVTDSAGRYVTDESSPRRTAYRTDGVIWDVGAIYRPNQRTSIEARAGRRYGSMSYTGSLSYQTGRASALQVGVYDSVTTFGRQLNGSIAMLPTSFVTTTDPFSDSYNGCVFSTTGTSAGTCLNSIFASATTSGYRARGVDAVYAMNIGRTRVGIGMGYVNRRYYSTATVSGSEYDIDGVTDQAWYGQAFYSRQLTRRAGVQADVIASYFNSGLDGSDEVFGGGVNGTFFYNLGRLGLNASVGIYGYDTGSGDQLSAQGTVAARYQF